MDTEATLEEMPRGRLRVFALVSPRPMHVSDVERLAPVDIERARLAERFTGVDVRSWDLSIQMVRDGGGK